MKLSKNLLAIVMAAIMIMTVMAPAMSFAALDVDPGEETGLTTYSTFSKAWPTEYYYPEGTHFVKNIAVHENTNESNLWSSIRSCVGGIDDNHAHILSSCYSTYYDDQTWGAFVYKDLNLGAGSLPRR